jgi:hypothetical protein
MSKVPKSDDGAHQHQTFGVGVRPAHIQMRCVQSYREARCGNERKETAAHRIAGSEIRAAGVHGP